MDLELWEQVNGAGTPESRAGQPGVVPRMSLLIFGRNCLKDFDGLHNVR
jgi:hypothetical protein